MAVAAVANPVLQLTVSGGGATGAVTVSFQVGGQGQEYRLVTNAPINADGTYSWTGTMQGIVPGATLTNFPSGTIIVNTGQHEGTICNFVGGSLTVG